MTPEPVSTRGSAGSGVSASGRGAGAPRRIRRIVTTRRGGVSATPYDSFNLGGGVGDSRQAVAANRARLARAAGLPAASVVWMRQVHGTAVTAVGATTADELAADQPEADGIVTVTTGLA